MRNYRDEETKTVAEREKPYVNGLLQNRNILARSDAKEYLAKVVGYVHELAASNFIADYRKLYYVYHTAVDPNVVARDDAMELIKYVKASIITSSGEAATDEEQEIVREFPNDRLMCELVTNKLVLESGNVLEYAKILRSFLNPINASEVSKAITNPVLLQHKDALEIIKLLTLREVKHDPENFSYILKAIQSEDILACANASEILAAMATEEEGKLYRAIFQMEESLEAGEITNALQMLWEDSAYLTKPVLQYFLKDFPRNFDLGFLHTLANTLRTIHDLRILNRISDIITDERLLRHRDYFQYIEAFANASYAIPVLYAKKLIKNSTMLSEIDLLPYVQDILNAQSIEEAGKRLKSAEKFEEDAVFLKNARTAAEEIADSDSKALATASLDQLEEILMPSVEEAKTSVQKAPKRRILQLGAFALKL